jgi:hypothetical protein
VFISDKFGFILKNLLEGGSRHSIPPLPQTTSGFLPKRKFSTSLGLENNHSILRIFVFDRV